MSEYPAGRPDDEQPHTSGGSPSGAPDNQPPSGLPESGWTGGSVAPGYGAAPQPGWYASPDDPLVSPNFGGWWTRAFALLSAAWRPMAVVQLFWALPLVLLDVFIILAPVETETGTNGEFTGGLLVALLISLGTDLVAMLLSFVTLLATVQILVQRATDQPVSVREALMTGLRRAPAMLGWGLLSGLLIMVGLLFCILPGLYVALAMSVLPVVVLLERGNGIGRAFELFHANFGAAIGRVATTAGVMLAFTLAGGALVLGLQPTDALSGDDVTVGVALTTAIISTTVSIISNVVVSPLLLTAYADMRARHEPFSTAYLRPAS
ncbi:hypothetical protein AB0M36_37305 [Actinoplanes sp. NPDC051346]|uniref:hypothetical protein n=1 Tax=Actinoplanes sp. NPDC051346 TaxID=3155048 RepID=UPI003413106B